MIINDATKLGSGGSNLVLETAGKVYIKVADRFYELDFKNPGGRIVRVGSSGEDQEAPEIDMSQYVTKKYLKSSLSNYITQRGWEDIQETKHMLENALLDGFTESINPITVETMQLIVGTECLQFDFIDGLLTGNVQGAGFELMEGNQLRCPDNYIKHLTIDGPSAVRPSTPIQLYSRWTVKNPSEDSDGNTYLELPEDDLSYYVYIRAPKYIDPNTQAPYTDAYVEEHIADDPKGSGIATYLISQSAIELETNDDPGYYYFLVAIVTSKSNGFRSIGYMNGFTEILPGQITAYVFKTPDGTQYLDFLSEKFKIGNSVNFLDWNVTTPNTLTIKGSLSATGGDVKTSIDRLNGLMGTVWFSLDAPSAQELPYPTVNVSTTNWPASLWTTDTIKEQHLGDRYYVESGTDTGKIFIYTHNTTNGYYWTEENNSDYEYLIKAIKGRTDLNGGLILANMMQLGHSWGSGDDIDDYYSKFVVMSGINGTLKTVDGTISYDTIAAWYGGPMRDLEKEYVSGNHYDYFVNTDSHNKYTFVEHDLATTGYYRWSPVDTALEDVYIQHNPPSIGDTVYNYTGGQLVDSGTTVEFYSNGFASSLFRMDGTGYLAKGNISWNKDGLLNASNLNVSVGQGDTPSRIGPLKVEYDKISVVDGVTKVFEVTPTSCHINGSLSAKSTGYWGSAAIEILDYSGTKIADIGSKPISPSSIDTYLYKSDATSVIHKKGSMFWGVVTIEDVNVPILNGYMCWGTGEVFSVTNMTINYNIARIKSPITADVILEKYDITNSRVVDNILMYRQTWSSGSPSDTITQAKLTNNSITLDEMYYYTLRLYLHPGGSVKSTMSSDSWINFDVDAGCQGMVQVKSGDDIELGTFIRPNGISSAFGKHSKFQWISAMKQNGYFPIDNRKGGGSFIVELPIDSTGDSSTNVTGIRINGYYDGAGNRVTNPGIRVNFGDTNWYRLEIDSNGFIKGVI